MARSRFFTNHLRVLGALTERPDLRLRDIAREVEITERAAQRIIGERDERQHLGRRFGEWTHCEDIPGDEEALAQLAAGGPSEFARDKRYVLPSGSVRWVSIRAATAADPRTGERLVFGHVVETGQRRRHERALAEAEERFRGAFDNAPIGVALVSVEGRFIKVNRALREITGYGETELLLRTFQDLTHPEDLDADLEFVRRMLAGEIRSYQMDKRYWHAEGHLIWISLSVSLVRDGADQPLYFIAQIEDITARGARRPPARTIGAWTCRPGRTPLPSGRRSPG